MKRADRDLWTAALRSGEYQQAKNQLALEYVPGLFSYCCLGVACKVFDVPGTYNSGGIDFGDHRGKSGSVLPYVLRYRFGPEWELGGGDIKITMPEFRNDYPYPVEDNPDAGTTSVSLTLLNDSGFTFNQIADIIDYFVEVED